ncbi:MAG: CoA transferase [Proteobacteria bacterium]|nr:CoA transferase [Pseudomonadota bacterium]
MYELLKGMRVVEVSAFIAAPYAGLSLAQMGADVIRIDPIGGGLDYRRWPVTKDGRSLYWAGLNKCKRSIALNVREEEGREIAHALITEPGPQSGMLITNLPPRGWLAYETIKAKRDDLIMVSIVGNRDGSVALDYTVNAAAGFPSVTGPVDHDAPVNHVMPVWDVVAGLSAVQGLMAAERKRRDTGEGEFVQLALSDTAFATLSHLGYVGEAEINKTDRPKTGNHVFGTYAQDFATSDGKRVMITAFTPRHWQVLVDATGTSGAMAAIEAELKIDLAREENRYAARDPITDVLRRWFEARSFQEIKSSMDAAGACWGPYQSFSEAVTGDSRLSVESPLFDEIDQPGIGRYRAAGAMMDFAGVERVPVRPAPILGQDTDEVLSEILGMGEGELARLHDRGIIGGATP